MKRIALSVVSMQVLGALWYSPVLFLPLWVAAQGKRPEELNMSNPLPFVYSIGSSILFSVILNAANEATGTKCAARGALRGAMLALGTTALGVATHYGFLNLPGILILIDGGKEIVAGALAGAILAAGYEKSNVSYTGVAPATA